MLTFLVKLLNLLNSENSARQMAFAISLGCLWGLSPAASVQAMFALLLVLLLKANLSSFIFSAGAFSALASIFVEPIAKLGENILLAPNLADTFSSLYQFSAFRFAQLHHTTTLGALLISVILFVPLYFFSAFIIEKYRVHIKAFFEKLRVVKALKASRFYRLYQTVSNQA